VLTDDQDVHLGGMVPMPKTRKLLGGLGATASNWFIHVSYREGAAKDALDLF
jgi:hypothetical protein